jgi:Domain of unknown function (DUF4166)
MIYRALLDGDFAKLPPVLRTFHSAPGKRCASGTMSIRRESGLLAWLVDFPPAGERVPVRLEVDGADGRETWTRWFGTLMRRSTQRAEGGLLVEEAGPVRIAFRIRASESGMSFESQRAELWGIPVPLHIEAFLRGGELSWEVEVRIRHVGSYRGVMIPKS